MPNPPEGWFWWFFSVVIAASIVGVAVNLFSNWVQKFLDNNFEKRRKKRLADKQFDARVVEEMVRLAEEDSSVLTVMANLVDVWQARAIRMLMLGYTALISGFVGSFNLPVVFMVQENNGYDVNEWFTLAAFIVCVGSLVGGGIAVNIGERTQKAGEIYAEVIFTYHQRHIHKVVDNMTKSDDENT